MFRTNFHRTMFSLLSGAPLREWWWWWRWRRSTTICFSYSHRGPLVLFHCLQYLYPSWQLTYLTFQLISTKWRTTRSPDCHPNADFLAVYECSCNHPGEPRVLKWVHHEKKTIKLLYASRSAAVSAHCLLWIDWSPVEPLHFGDFSIFDYTAIEIRMRRFFLSPLSWLGGSVAFSWLTGEIDTRVASYQAKHFNPALIADIVPSFSFHCVLIAWEYSLLLRTRGMIDHI